MKKRKRPDCNKQEQTVSIEKLQNIYTMILTCNILVMKESLKCYNRTDKENIAQRTLDGLNIQLNGMITQMKDCIEEIKKLK